MKRSKSIVDDLRRAVAQAQRRGVSRYRMAKDTGLSQAMLSRFMAGKTVPMLDTAQRIAQGVGRRLVLVDADTA